MLSLEWPMQCTQIQDGRVTLIFEGYSDDTFGEVAHFNVDYDNCGSMEPIAFLLEHKLDFDFSREGWRPVGAIYEGLVVVGHYGLFGPTWTIGVTNACTPWGTAVPIPNWPFTLRQSEETPHGPSLIVEVPRGTTITCLTGLKN